MRPMKDVHEDCNFTEYSLNIQASPCLPKWSTWKGGSETRCDTARDVRERNTWTFKIKPLNLLMWARKSLQGSSLLSWAGSCMMVWELKSTLNIVKHPCKKIRSDLLPWPNFNNLALILDLLLPLYLPAMLFVLCTKFKNSTRQISLPPYS